MRFSGKTVLVTGASRGLGRAIALGFGREGAFVAATFQNKKAEAEAVVEELQAAGGSGIALQLEIGDPAAVEGAVLELNRLRGQIDVAVANAAIAEDAFFTMAEPGSFERVVATNLGGTANVCRAAARVMMPHRSGAIVTLASVVGLHASPGQASYAASKGGIIALSKTLAAELAPRGIRVNCVAPGLCAAGLAARMNHRTLATRKAMIPLGRLGEADEIARAVVFLASDDASYIVGHTLVVDGGLSA